MKTVLNNAENQIKLFLMTLSAIGFGIYTLMESIMM